MKIVLKRTWQQTIEVNESDTVKSLKRMLMDKKGIPPCLQTLQLNGEDLEDGRTLADCGVTEGASIEVHQASGCDGGGCMQIFFKLAPDGEKIPLGAHTFDMIYEIKKKIADKLKIVASEHHIMFKGNALEDNLSLAECDVVDQSVLGVIQKKWRNIVIRRIDGEPIELRVDKRDTVKKAKELIFDVAGIPLSVQNIIFNDKLLEDNSYFKDYNISNNSVLWLIQKSSSMGKIKVSVSAPPHKKKIRLEVNPCDSVKNVTNMALKSFAMKVPGSLKFNGEFLDESSSLAACGVSDGDDLYIGRRNEMRINVKTHTGKTLTFIMERNSTVYQLMHKIMKEEGVLMTDQRLIFAGKQLEAGETLADHGIQDEDTLHLVLRICGC